MIDENRYIILEKRAYETRKEAEQQIFDCYSNLLGVIAFPDGGKWYIVRVKNAM